MNRIFGLALWGLVMVGFAERLMGQTANDRVEPYGPQLVQGSNMGWYDPWPNRDLGRIAAGDVGVPGVGVEALRPALFAWFLEERGYEDRVPAFQKYVSLGMPDNVVFLGYPSEAQRGTEQWCAEEKSLLFKNMWEPIWDNGANGTLVNENNDYALYVYKTVRVYHPYVRFWEVWNEPDINYSGNGWKDERFAESWFNQEIAPCELQMRAPIQAYNRMLRITYEIVKSIAPEDYVAVGGLGFPSFLDAILRNTDEPSGGDVTGEYPLGGGAYFDAMSFHVYPHLEGLRAWNNSANQFDYFRHSDSAVAAVRNKQLAFARVLDRYGYDGQRYPRKVDLITEVNMPRRAFGHDGATQASALQQRSFMLKLLAKAQTWGIAQIHPYQLADAATEAEATNEFDIMGFYYSIRGHTVPDVVPTELGIAYRTYGLLLGQAVVDEAATALLALDPALDGVGFRLPSGRQAFLV